LKNLEGPLVKKVIVLLSLVSQLLPPHRS